MIELRHKNLRSIRSDIRLPDYDRSQLRPGIVHLGVGNFHRVHQATAIEECLCVPGNEHWAISGIGMTNGPAARKKTPAYRLQDNLYTATESKSDLSMVTRVVGAMAKYLHAPENPQRVLDRLTDPMTRIVSLTITEGGYNIDETTREFRLDQTDVRHDLSNALPRTAFGFIVRALEVRRKTGLKPFTVVSCDNLRSNGDTARRAIVSFARAVSSDLATWIEEKKAFPNSMVDRIAPQVLEEEKLRINASSATESRSRRCSEDNGLPCQNDSRVDREWQEPHQRSVHAGLLFTVPSRGSLIWRNLSPSMNRNSMTTTGECCAGNNPTGLLGTTPFRSLDLEGCGPFKEQYLKLSHQLAADGCRAALDAILV